MLHIFFKDDSFEGENISKITTRCRLKADKKELSNTGALSIGFSWKFVKASDRTFFDLNTFASQSLQSCTDRGRH